MDVRRFVRGTIPWPDLERVAEEIRARYDRQVIRVAFLETNNWLSTPMVVDNEWFVKVLSPQNARVHAIFTGARNLGAFTSGSVTFFEHYESPYEMARHEFEATRMMRSIGLNAPAPVETFQVDEFGILVLEYLPEFESLTDIPISKVHTISPQLFAALAQMHEHGLVHGDLRGENVLIFDGEIYFIDATNVSEDGIDDAMAYDLACALATLSPVIGSRKAVSDALVEYSIETLLSARSFVDFVRLRPDHEFDAGRVKGEIEKRASHELR